MARVDMCDICGNVMERSHSERYRVIIKHTVFNLLGEHNTADLEICSDCMYRIVQNIRKELNNDR